MGGICTTRDKEQKKELTAQQIEQIKKFQQEHVLAAIDKLETKEEKQKLVEQLCTVDFAMMNQLFQLVGKETDKGNIAPIQNIKKLNQMTPEYKDLIYQAGLKALAAGQVGVIMMAGGQGSRLGYEHPKGMYDQIGLQSNKSIFQLHAERILKAQELAFNSKHSKKTKVKEDLIKFYVMTSEGQNHNETTEFFAKNNYFGLKKDKVRFFQQGMLPAITSEGKVIFDQKDVLKWAPNGNGDIYRSLKTHKLVEEFQKEGIKYLHICGVDNVLVKLADPSFIGFAALEKKKVTSKFVKKAHAGEKVGVHVLQNGKPAIVEYTEIAQLADQKDEHGDLLYCAGNIVNMVLTTEFLKDIVSDEKQKQLNEKYHVATKKIPYFDIESQKTVKVDKENGHKFELFIFDAFPFADDIALIECLREDEFAPIKNPNTEKSDSPNTAKQMMQALHKKWLEAKGVKFSHDFDHHHKLEISPLISYEGEGLDKIAEELKSKGEVNQSQYIK